MKRKKGDNLKTFAWIFGAMWVASMVAFSFVLGIATNWFKGTVQDTGFGNSDSFIFYFLGTILVGTISFILMVLLLFTQGYIEKNKKSPNKNFIGKTKIFIKGLLVFSILPLYMTSNLLKLPEIFKKIKNKKLKFSFFKPKNYKSLILKIFQIALILVFLLPFWIGGYFVIGISAMELLGYNPDPISISGTGSMYPTFSKGSGKDPKELSKQVVATPGMMRYPNGIFIFGKNMFGHQIERGDIVVVQNKRIEELNEKITGQKTGWVKRVVGLPNETIELKNGIVYINDEPLLEPYTAKPHSTFGEGFLSECSKIVIPGNSIFVMGDNRKGSGDSREVGFIKLSEVNHVLPLKKQENGLKSTWRDTSNDFNDSTKLKLNSQKYLELLNKKRVEAGVKPLTYQAKLEESASKRGKIIIEYNDFSYEATMSGYTQLKAMNDSGYSNITYGEAPRQGYFEADELIENQFEFPETKDFLLNSNYQEIGISEVEGEINGCPIQVIVQHFAGYIPPNYTKEVVESWKNLLSRLREIQPSWEKLKEYPNRYNMDNVNRINEIISTRISRISSIVARMESNKWLSIEENNWAYSDKTLSVEQENLANKLNK